MGIKIPSLWFTNVVLARSMLDSVLNNFIVITMLRSDGVDLVMRKSSRGCKQTPIFPTCEEEKVMFGLFVRCVRHFFSTVIPMAIYIVYINMVDS